MRLFHSCISFTTKVFSCFIKRISVSVNVSTWQVLNSEAVSSLCSLPAPRTCAMEEQSLISGESKHEPSYHIFTVSTTLILNKLHKPSAVLLLVRLSVATVLRQELEGCWALSCTVSCLSSIVQVVPKLRSQRWSFPAAFQACCVPVWSMESWIPSCFWLPSLKGCVDWCLTCLKSSTL